MKQKERAALGNLFTAIDDVLDTMINEITQQPETDTQKVISHLYRTYIITRTLYIK